MARSDRSVHPVARNGNARRRMLISRNSPTTEPTATATAAAIRGRSVTEPQRLAGTVDEASAGLAAVAHLVRSPAPATWVFTGDSITHGALYTEGWRSFPEHFAERVRWELRRFHDVVINTGVCGEKAGGLLQQLEQRVLRFRPDVVLLLIGMNDSLAGPDGRQNFATNLREVAGRIREAGAIPVLQTPNTVYAPNAITRSDLPAYVEIIRDVAARDEFPLIDHWQHWNDRKPDPQSLLEWLQDQSIHPNYYGHREMTRLICDAFEIFDDASLTCSLEVP